ncbi:hypothetical protein KBY55_05160 [Streptomyces sp. b94]|uniref:hypothetical protein n=1 Tax=Streptomyces sp. b94 TaxID=1827634 RepID=UPI001B37EC68|nr:hypothetical protein [Streptomyces sp. b94]MBQ1095489.1 hypothetical protein [Streptomyces sp. b94]
MQDDEEAPRIHGYVDAPMWTVTVEQYEDFIENIEMRLPDVEHLLRHTDRFPTCGRAGPLG